MHGYLKSLALALCTLIASIICTDARAQRAGQPDDTFGGNENGIHIAAYPPNGITVYSAASNQDGKIYVAGVVSDSKSTSQRPALVIMSRHGIVEDIREYQLTSAPHDASFSKVIVLKDQSILAAGSFQDADNEYASGLVCKFSQSGEFDSSFAVDSPFDGCELLHDSTSVIDISEQPEGGMVIAGTRPTENDAQTGFIGRLQPSGERDYSFGSNMGLASLPAPYSSSNRVTRVNIAPNGDILGLWTIGGSVVVSRHRNNGLPALDFSDDGALVVSQFSTAQGMALGNDGSMYISFLGQNGASRDVTVAKLTADGSPAGDFTGPNSLPGQVDIEVCGAGVCSLLPSSRPSNLFALPDGRLVLGISAYFGEIEASRFLSLRLDATGQPDAEYGGNDNHVAEGIGTSAAVAGNFSLYSSVMRNGRHAIIGVNDNGSTRRLIAAAFRGDAIFSDSFD